MEPIHGQDQTHTAEHLFEFSGFPDNILVERGGSELLDVNTHRKGIDAGHVIRSLDLAHVMLVTDNTERGLQKVMRVLVGMKSDQVGAQHPLENPAAPLCWQYPEYLERWKRNVEKKPHRELGMASLEQTRQKHEMIVVHPDNIIRSQHCFESVGKKIVDLLVLLPELRLVNGVRGEVMKQRPDRRVTKNQIELVHLFGAQKYRVGAAARKGFLNDLLLQRTLDTATGPADPKMLKGQRRSVIA